MTHKQSSNSMLKGAVSVMALALWVGPAGAQGAPVEIEIESQPLSRALLEFNEQTGATVAVPHQLIDGKVAPAIKGEMTPEAALTVLLADSGLVPNALPDGGYTISQVQEEAAPERQPESFRVVQSNLEQDNRRLSAQLESEGESIQETVYVTAQKRGEQNLLDVPISIGVLGGAQLDARGVNGVAEVLNTVGGVNMFEEAPGQTTIAVRGVAGQRRFAGGSTTGYYIDGAAFGFPKSAFVPDASAFDLERVEVLRGPQGTLYGAGSLNGVVRIITKDAVLDEVQAKGRLSYSNTEGGDSNYSGDIAINFPLIEDRLAIRAVASRHDYGGWIDVREGENLIDDTFGNNINGGTSEAYRLKMNAAPTDRFSVEALASYSQIDNDAPSRARDDGTTVFSVDQPQLLENEIYSLELGYDFGAVSLTGVTSYSELQIDMNEQLTLGGALPAAVDTDQQRARSFSQEVRFATKLDGPLQWTGGYYYRDSEQTLRQQVSGFGTALSHQVTDSVSWAVFGEVAGSFLDDKAELAFGLRYFEDEVTFTELAQLFPSPDPLVGEARTFDDLSPRIALTLFPSDDHTIYGAISKGFRSGALETLNARLDDTAQSSVLPDTLWNYEVGAKGVLFGGELVYDTAIYYIDWDDVQQSGLSPVGTSLLRNVGGASGLGVDASLSATPLEGLSATASFGWSGLEVDETENIPGIGPIFDIGDRINQSAEYTGAVSLDYTFPLGSSGLDARLSGSANYFSEVTFRQLVGGLTGRVFENESDNILTSRVSFGVEKDGRWSVSVYANNLNNEDGSAQAARPSLGGTTARLRPRSVGVLLTASY